MDNQVNILMLEDEPLDAELVWQTLGSGTFSFTGKLVDSRSAYCKELKSFSPDLILSDYNLPAFDGMEALKIAQRECPDIPFIFISGILGEDRAIETLKSGATDYVLKDNLSRLKPAVERALSEAEEHAKLQKTEKALKDSEERYALAAQGANDGLWDWDLNTDVIYFSPRWKEMIGFKDNEIGNFSEEWLNRLHEDDIKRVNEAFRKHKKGHTPQFKCEYRIKHRNGSYRWVLSRGICIRDESGKAYRMSGSQTDITHQKRAEKQILFDAFHDGLTRLPNRTLFLDHLGRSIERVKRSKQYLYSVLMLDFDEFKKVNDSLGHKAGDRLLVDISKRLQMSLFPGDTIARIGGDEFAILADDLNKAQDTDRVAVKIKAQLSKAFELDGQKIYMTVSIGIAHGSNKYKRPEDLLRDAETAMYHAKTLGKARHVEFNSKMHFYLKSRLSIETDLRLAIEQKEFRVYYQPIVSLIDGRVVGLEALLRWQSQKRGMVTPENFIYILEETGMIINIGSWVLAESCSRLQQWQKENSRNSELSLSVNLSPRQLGETGLVREVEMILEKNSLAPHSLKLEITENMIMDRSEYAIGILNQLRSSGVKLMMDDFGTGYSSLSYLHRFPIDVLKIDRSFITDMERKKENVEIVKAIIAMAKNLGMEIVAEGIETIRQLEILQDLNCDYGQGFFFAKPLRAEDVSILLNNKPQW